MAEIFVFLQKLIAFVAAIFGIFGINQKTTTVELYANPASGYTWEYSIDNDDVLSLISSNYKPNISSIESGGGGTQQFTFEGVSEGTANVTFRYVSRTDGSVASGYIYTYKVNSSGKVELIEKNTISYTAHGIELILE